MSKLICAFFTIIALIWFVFCQMGYGPTGIAWGWFESDAEIAQAKADQYKAEKELNQTEIEKIRVRAEAEVKLMQNRAIYQPNIQHVAQSNSTGGNWVLFILLFCVILLLFAVFCVFLLKYNKRSMPHLAYPEKTERIIDQNGNEYKVKYIQVNKKIERYHE